MSEPITPAKGPSIEQMRALISNKQTAAAEPPKPIATMQKGKDGSIDVTDQVIDVLVDPVALKIKPVIVKTIADGLEDEAKSLRTEIAKTTDNLEKAIKADSAKLDAQAEKLASDLTALANKVRPVQIQTEQNTYDIEGVAHGKFELLLRVVGANLPVFMVGPAGTGKTAAAERVANALSIPFYAMSVGSQTSKSDIFGYKDATGQYHETPFYLAYKNGGVFLLDEADAGNANVLVGLNAALSNGYVFFPDGSMTAMHKDFRMIATANTFGNGASRQYVGRNQLDAATLDRFTVITWDIDDQIETAISTISPTYGARWLKVVRAVREEAITKLELRAVVSPRATLRGATLLEAGVEYEDVVQVALIANMPEAEREVLLNLANATWAKGAGEKRRGRPPGSKNRADLDSLVSVFESAEEAD